MNGRLSYKKVSDSDAIVTFQTRYKKGTSKCVRVHTMTVYYEAELHRHSLSTSGFQGSDMSVSHPCLVSTLV